MWPWFAPYIVSPGDLEEAVDSCTSPCMLQLEPETYPDNVTVASGRDITLETYGAELDGVFSVEPGGTLTVNDALINGTVSVSGTVTLDQPTTKGGSHPLPLVELLDASAVLTVLGGEFSGFQTEEGVVRVQAGTATFDDTLFQNNASLAPAGGGAAFVVTGGLVHLQDVYLIDNTALGSGGAILQTGGRVELDRCSLTQNEAPYGGAIATQGGELDISEGSFIQNTAAFDGGAILLAVGEPDVVVATDFVDNTALFTGGAISGAVGTLRLDGVRSVRNLATTGGSVYFEGDLVVERSTFEGDAAIGDGGAVFVHLGNSSQITQSAFCEVVSAGSAIHASVGSGMRVSHTVFGGGDGGAVTADGSVVEVDHVTVIDQERLGSALALGTLIVSASLVGPLGGGPAFDIDGTSSAEIDQVAFDPAPASLGQVAGAPLRDPIQWLASAVPTGEHWDPPCPNGPEFRIHPDSAQVGAGPDGIDLGALGILYGPWAVDRDDDGTLWTYDCNEGDPTVHGLAVEIPGDGVDQDCDGLVDELDPTGPPDTGAPGGTDTGTPPGPDPGTPPGPGTETPGGHSGRGASRAGSGRCDCASGATPGPAGFPVLGLVSWAVSRRRRPVDGVSATSSS